MIVPKRHDFATYEDSPYTVEVWLVVDSDVWYIHCMDCGTHTGTVNAGNERGAIRLTEDHNKALHNG